jgi:hypothetical protein
VSEPVTPPWLDDLFPFPTPPVLARLVDIAWEHATREGYYDYTLMSTYFDFMFDLATFPRPPEGWECSPEVDDVSRLRRVLASAPMFVTPEFVPFGALGDGGYVGWLVPAPELDRPDHPVALASGHDYRVSVIGADTRAGLEFMLSRGLRRQRERQQDPERDSQDPVAEYLRDKYRELIPRLAAEIGAHLDPDGAVESVADVVFDVPAGWRHEMGEDGIGVLAPAGTFADREPVVAHVQYEEQPVAPALADAAHLLDIGYPATALLGLKDTFVNSPPCYFAELNPLWARAYRDLGRPGLAQHLDLMTATYRDLPCYCQAPHN